MSTLKLLRSTFWAFAAGTCLLAQPAQVAARRHVRPPEDAPVVRRTRRIWKALGNGDIGPLREWAGPRIHWLVVEGSRARSGDVPTTRLALRPLLRWAEHHRKEEIRRVVLRSNIRPDGYTIVSLRLQRGSFDVGITRDGRLHKVFATRHPTAWD